MSIVFIGVGLPGIVDTWRSKWPADELHRRGHDAYYIGHGGDHTNRGWVHNDTYIVHANNQDVGLYGTVKELRSLGGKCWVQFDDDYRQQGLIQDVVDHELISLSAGLPSALPRKYNPRGWFENMTDDHRAGIAAADGLIAATEEVADAYREWASGPVVVCHNWLPKWVTELRRNRIEPPVAGWFGGVGAHWRDWEWLGTHTRDIERFGVIGEPEKVAEITGADIVYGKGWQTWTKLYREVGRFSVGVIPVVDDAFNRPKSWIKPVEFAAMGIPSVAGTIPSYLRARERSLLIPYVLADTPDGMVRGVNFLLETDREMSDYLRSEVREKFTIEGPGGDEWEEWVREHAG